MNCSGLHNGIESITIINTILLSETTGDKTSFIFINRTIGSLLYLENPLATHNIDSMRPRNQDPGISALESRKFLCHGITPRRLTKCIAM
jgi:hypothetical protein